MQWIENLILKIALLAETYTLIAENVHILPPKNHKWIENGD